MISTDIHVQFFMKNFEWGFILQLNVTEDKLYIIPDAEQDGFEREGGGKGVETYVYIHEQNENIKHKILTSFCWFVLSFIWGGGGGTQKGVLPK